MANGLQRLREQLISTDPVQTNPIQTVATNQPSTSTLPRSAPAIDQAKVQEFKDIGSAFNNITKILENPAAIKGLAQFGIAIGRGDPTSTGLGNFAIQNAEDIARQNFAADLAAGVAQPRTAGLSTEGRTAELALFRQTSQDAISEDQRQIENQQRQERLDLQREELNQSLLLDQRQLTLRERVADANISEAEFSQILKDRSLELEADRLAQNAKRIQIESSRARFQNLLDQARAEDISRGESTGSQVKLADLAKVRDQFIENINQEIQDLEDQRERINDNIESLQDEGGPLRDKVNAFFGGDKAEEREAALEAARTRLAEIETQQADYQAKIDELINDTVKDLGGKPNIIGIGNPNGSSSSFSGPASLDPNNNPTEPSIVDSNSDLNSISDGQVFQAGPKLKAALEAKGRSGTLFYKQGTQIIPVDTTEAQ
jgi:hypothetical protein